MPDLSSASEVVEQYRQEFNWADVEAAWRIVLTAGVLLGIVALILYAYWLLDSWRKPPPPPRSIVPEQPHGRRRYTEPTRR